MGSLTAEITISGTVETEFVTEAMRRAEAAGYRPAQFQRPVDWSMVRYWADLASDSDFAWRAADYNSDGAIIVGPTTQGSVAVHSGQHRILGGLMAHRPVPRHVMTWISVEDRGRGWNEAPAECDMWSFLP